MIATDGNVSVDVIDNGVNTDGTLNYALIFTPYEAVYVENEADGRYTLATGTSDTIYISKDCKILDAVAFEPVTIAKSEA